MHGEYHVHNIFYAADSLCLIYQVLGLGGAVMVVFIGCNVLFISNLKMSSGLSRTFGTSQLVNATVVVF